MGNGALSFDEWCNHQRRKVPQFQYWHTALQLELLLLVFLKSLRLADFGVYVDVYKMLPWFFALNHTNYARWLPIHVRDMRELDSKAPAVAEAFKQGLFTVTKTRRRFSCIAIDQAHEQNNAMVKDDGGAVGLTENASALRRWMLSGPEMARLVNEFEACMAPEVRPETNNHHEAERGYQAAYHKDVRSLVDVLDDLGNPFEEEGKDLIVLDTKVVADEGGVSRMQQIEDLGVKQCDTFISERLIQRTKPLDDPISRNKLSFFETPSKKKISKAQQQLSSMKSDCSLFSRLFIACEQKW